MKKIWLKIAGVVFLLKIPLTLSGQASAGNFDVEINYYKSIDAASSSPIQPILFIGSSSIKNWIRLDSCFQGYPVLNRGFGGSTISDQIKYADDIILSHNPKQIVLYCGENDFAQGSTPEIVYDRFKNLYAIIRNKFPEVPVVYISLKPSPSKINMMDSITAYNQLVFNYIQNQNNITYANVFPAMLDGDGKPNRDLFYEDMLHMNEKGYAVWTAVVKPYLVK